jgi:hypothetical protein
MNREIKESIKDGIAGAFFGFISALAIMLVGFLIAQKIWEFLH